MPNSEKNIPSYKGKTAVVMGLGKSGVAVAKFLHSRGAKVKVSDIKPKDHLADAARQLANLEPPVEFEFGGNSIEFFSGADFVVYSPSVSGNTAILQEMRTRNVPTLTPVELALREINVPVVAFVGNRGKTSTIEMTRHILRTAGKKVFCASDLHGNLIEAIARPADYDLVLLELSTAELEKVQNFKPAMTVFTGLQKHKPNEFPTIEDYYRVSMSALKNADDTTAIIYNYRDPALRMLVPPFPGKKSLVRRKDVAAPAGAQVASPRGAYLVTTKDMVWTNGEVKEEYDLRYAPIYGLHNRDNLMYAVSVAKELGISHADVQKAIHTFEGVPHRLQLVRKKGGVRFINDSRATTAECLYRALDAFPLDSIILIAGGKQAPDANFTALVEFVKKRVKTMILVGEAKEQINRDVGDHSETFLVGTFEEAILLSYQKSREGDVILLSPGCESYDMFNSYEERGEYFTKYLDEL